MISHFFTRPFCVIGDSKEFPITQKTRPAKTKRDKRKSG